MTDKIKYSNISVSKDTYAKLQQISKQILPGLTPLSISKTVTLLANMKIEEFDNELEACGYQTEKTGFTPPNKIIEWVKNNSTNKKERKNEEK